VTYHVSGGVGPATPFALASLGKTMTAVAVLRSVARGQHSLDDVPQAHLPADLVAELDLPDGLTLRHLLTMTSGLPDYLDDAFVADALENLRAPRHRARPCAMLLAKSGYSRRVRASSIPKRIIFCWA